MTKLKDYFSKLEIILWILASLSDRKYVSVVICFAAFLINDIYGFISWSKMKIRQQKVSDSGV